MTPLLCDSETAHYFECALLAEVDGLKRVEVFSIGDHVMLVKLRLSWWRQLLPSTRRAAKSQAIDVLVECTPTGFGVVVEV